jgi:hypothetical protein
MNTHDVVQGTLKPDGTLELNKPPNLTPGPVLVTIQAVISGPPTQRGLAQIIDEITQSQQARGFQGRSAKEIDNDRLDAEDEYEQRMLELWSAAQSGPPSSGS